MQQSFHRARTDRPGARRVTPRCEALEDRVVLSLGSQFSVGGSGFFAPAVAKAADGSYVVAWADFDTVGQVHVQRYNSDDSPRGSAILPSTPGDTPSVAFDAEGDFIVAWHTDEYDGDNNNLRAQVFDFSTGDAEGSEFQVNQTTGTNLFQSCWRAPKVAMNASGDFVFTWDRHNGDHAGIWARLYDAQGAAVTDEFLVDGMDVGTYDTGKPSVAMDSTGDFVVAYGIGTGSYLDPGKYEVHFKRYNSSAVAQGSKVYVATSRDEDDANHGPAIAMDANGEFVIAWANSLTEDGVFAQVFNNDGTDRTDIITVYDYGPNTNDVRLPYSPAVAMNASGQWAITWSERSEPYEAPFNLYGEIFDVDGNSLASMLVSEQNPYHTTSFLYSAVGIDADGNFSAAYFDVNYDVDPTVGQLRARSYTY